MGDMGKCLEHHPKTKPCAIDALEEDHIEQMNQWIKSKDQEILLIQWTREDDSPIRTTDLALELIGIYEKATGEPVLSHFCSEPAEETLGIFEFVIQDLTIQFLERHADKFMDPQRPFQKHLTSSKFQEMAKDIERLWELFRECIVFAKPHSIAIILDNVETMHTTGRIYEQGEAEYEFYHRLQSLLKGLQEDNDIVVKVIVTSRSPQADYHFEGVAGLHITI